MSMTCIILSVVQTETQTLGGNIQQNIPLTSPHTFYPDKIEFHWDQHTMSCLLSLFLRHSCLRLLIVNSSLNRSLGLFDMIGYYAQIQLYKVDYHDCLRLSVVVGNWLFKSKRVNKIV